MVSTIYKGYLVCNGTLLAIKALLPYLNLNIVFLIGYWIQMNISMSKRQEFY